MVSRQPLSATVLRSPLLWGGAATVGFYWLIHQNQVSDPFVVRYFASHPVEYTSTALFLVGMAALVLKTLDLIMQWRVADRRPNIESPSGGFQASDASYLRTQVASEHGIGTGYLRQRLDEALAHIQRQGTAEALEEQLKYLSDQAAAKAHSSYALVRIIVWAIPILGFLGTVIGITLAIAKLSPESLESSLPEVTSGLGVAFDTTALALSLSMVLMFSQFVTDRIENRLLTEVDERASDILGDWYQVGGSGGDPQMIALHRMTERIAHSMELLIQRQAELWQSTIEAAHERWSQLGGRTQEMIETALHESLSLHAQRLVEAEATAANSARAHWVELETAVKGQVEAARDLQHEVAQQGDVLLRVVEATGQVTRLEDTLSKNLAALSGTQQFEETLHSLAAATHLLTARLGGSAGGQVDLKARRSESHAA